MFKRFLIVGGILVAVVFLGVAWLFISFRRSPIEMFEKMGRLHLKMTGGEKHQVEAPSGTLVYWTVGEGPTVFLIHGANDQAGRWSKSVALLKGSYRFVIPDMPGHGESDPATGAIRMEMLVEAVGTLKAKESPDQPVVLVGNSLGGWVSMLYTLDHPDDVRQLVLEDSGGISVDYDGPSLLPTTREEARAAFEATIVRTPVPDFIVDDFLEYAPTSPVARMMDEKFEDYVVDDRLAELNVPTTLIWGEGDKLADLEYAGRLKSMIAGAELHTIARCGHVPHNECATEFSALLDDSLKKEGQ